MSIFNKAIKALSKNFKIQAALERIVIDIQYIQGIGAGSNVQSSGEFMVFKLLRNLKGPYCCFDVGSNKGQYLSLLLDNLGTDIDEITAIPTNISVPV